MAKKLNKFEMLEYRKYRQPNTKYNRCKVNGVKISTSNGKEHEMAKASFAYDLMKSGEKIISESEEISTGLRRDLVSLSTGEIYEFETTMKRALRFLGKPVNIVPVGWSLDDPKWLKMKLKE